MSVILAVLAALAYGVGDFVGGIASRRRSAITILLYSYPVGGALMIALVPFFPGQLTGRVAAFGALGGVSGMLGVVLMYSLMTVAPMNVISPVTAVLAALVPVVAGVVVGESPAALTWFAIALGLLAVVLVSRTSEDNPHGPMNPKVLALALLSGVGFGFYFVFLARAGSDSGIWPLVISRITSAVLIVPLAYKRGAISGISRDLVPLVITAGALDAAANLFFLLATRHGYLSIAGVITSLYPAATVLLAVAVLREHTGRLQRVGLVLAAVSIALIARG